MSEIMAARRIEVSDAGAPPIFQNTYAELPDRFFAKPDPNVVAEPKLIRLNGPLALELAIDPDWLASTDGIDMLAGNRFPASAKPIALAYAGHQFGNFVPRLGDGRALLVGELRDTTGKLRDLQLKGSGPTRFSRNGDGRAAVGPVLREYIVSEAMAALGIPTTRTLAAVLTGEPVFREIRLPGAIGARVAASHIRIGTFQYFAARDDFSAVRDLADYSIRRHFPELAERDEPYLALLESVVQAQADLVARWMLIGFIHGVMNTDNTTISGETIDYGPCAFMDEFDAGTVFSSIDTHGRYAYRNQPHIAAWNLTRFSETLLPLLHSDTEQAVAKAETVLTTFQPIFEAAFHGGLRQKIGLFTERDGDAELIGSLFALMSRTKADFTMTFRSLADEVTKSGSAKLQFAEQNAFDDWAKRWRLRLAQESEHAETRKEIMLSTNPKYIPRNHRIEAVISAAVNENDFRPFEELLDVVTKPFDEQPGKSEYALPPKEQEKVLHTFCGT